MTSWVSSDPRPRDSSRRTSSSIGTCEVDRHLHGDPQLARGVVRDLGLVDRAREAVEHVAAGLARREDRLAQHVEHHLVRHEVSPRDVLLHLLAERGAVGDVLAQQVAARDVRDPEALGDADRLGPLAGAGGTDEQESHGGHPALSGRAGAQVSTPRVAP